MNNSDNQIYVSAPSDEDEREEQKSNFGVQKCDQEDDEDEINERGSDLSGSYEPRESKKTEDEYQINAPLEAGDLASCSSENNNLTG